MQRTHGPDAEATHPRGRLRHGCGAAAAGRRESAAQQRSVQAQQSLLACVAVGQHLRKCSSRLASAPPPCALRARRDCSEAQLRQGGSALPAP